MVKLNKGFTLIELLVVIAIIGILSSVVLASLNTARGKGADAAAKSNLNNIRAQAEIVYDNTNSYATVCIGTSDANVIKGIAAAASVEGLTWAGTGTTPGTNTTNVGCQSNATAWAAWVQLIKGNTGGTVYWCVDSTGTSKSTTAPGATTITVCP